MYARRRQGVFCISRYRRVTHTREEGWGDRESRNVDVFRTPALTHDRPEIRLAFGEGSWAGFLTLSTLANSDLYGNTAGTVGPIRANIDYLSYGKAELFAVSRNIPRTIR